MPSPSRREFIASSAVALSAATYTGAADKPSDRVRLAVMGVRSRGKDLIRAFAAQPSVEISHVIDPDESKHADAVNLLKKQETPPKIETDIRKVLEDRSVDVLVVAAPDHWHALAT